MRANPTRRSLTELRVIVPVTLPQNMSLVIQCRIGERNVLARRVMKMNTFGSGSEFDYEVFGKIVRVDDWVGT